MGLLTGLMPYGIVLAVIAGMWVAHKAQVAYAGFAGKREGAAECRVEWQADIDRRTAEAVEVRAARDLELKRATEAAFQRGAKSNEAFGKIQAAVGGVAYRGGVSIPGDVVRVLEDSSAAARGATAVEAGERPAEAVPRGAEAAVYDERELAQYFKDAAEAYTDAWQAWAAARDEYNALRSAQGKIKE